MRPAPRPRPRAAAWAEALGAGANAAAHVGLARPTAERAALDELARRSIGPQASMRPNLAEGTMHGLVTHLRQPAPDRVLSAAAACPLEAPAEPGGL